MADEEPLSPAARLFQSPTFNCYIIAMLGCKTKINPTAVMEGLEQTLIKHPRFSSKLVIDGNNKGKQKWIRTEVNAEDHVFVPDINPEMENADEFVEDYVSNLTTIPMDTSKPLWELHLLNVKTTDSEAVSVLKAHHSIGDGMSLMSLVLACARKTSNPNELPSLPIRRQGYGLSSSRSDNRFWYRLVLTVWSAILLGLNTCFDVLAFVATVLFLQDTETPVKGGPGVENRPKLMVHRIVSMDDIKLIKSAMNMTINDVILGVTQAGLSLYLNRRYRDTKKREESSEKIDDLPKRIRLRGAILVNIRPSTGIQALADMMAKGSSCRWGNCIGYIILPFSMALHSDPLLHLRNAKATIDRKKKSLEALFSFAAGRFILERFGVQVAARIMHRAVSNTTMSFSNMVGPIEEISFYGHPITYIAPGVYGHPHALTIHFQSYMNKMTISLTVDPAVIPDPHQLCDDLEESLKRIKAAVLERGF